ncbi:MAG: hypothetical protein BroJett040_09800 [Oligoflexia bacterium]|nr:MAG: hypothetical protein BroJett040_09800 [Oligoflexia bacterium]
MDIHFAPKDRVLALLPIFALGAAVTFAPAKIKTHRFQQITSTLNIQTKKAEPPRVAFLAAMKIPAQSDTVMAAQKNVGLALNEVVGKSGLRIPDSVRTKRININEMVFEKEVLSARAESRKWIEDLSDSQQKRLLYADQEHGTLDQDWKIPSWKDLAREKIEEVQNAELQQAGKSKDRVIVYSQNEAGEKVTPQSVRTKGVEVKEDAPTGFKVQGHIELVEGAILGSDRFIEIRRFVDGIPREVGRYELNGAFSINIKDMSGSIQAELYDQTNQVLASGSYRMAKNENASALKKIKIQIKPRNYLAGSFYDFNKATESLQAKKIQSNQSIKASVYSATLDAEVKTDELGSFQIPNISDKSWGIIRTEASKFYPAIQLSSAGRQEHQPLFTESFVRAVLSIVRDQQKASFHAETDSLVMGQVLVDGKPLSDVQVQVEGYEDYPAVYMSGWIPDSNLNQTTANGYFVITDLPKGLHSLVAKRAGQYIGHVNVVVDDGHASTALIEGSSYQQKADVKAYDAFTGESIATTVELQSLQEPIHVDGYAEVLLQNIKRHSLAISEPDDKQYISAQYVYSDEDEFIHFPSIKESFLTAMALGSRVNIQPEMGTIVGFVPEEDFDVYLTHEKEYSTENIVYFDHTGARSSAPVSGGGFILFNVPVGTQSVVVASKKSDRILSRVIPVELRSTTILKLLF